MFAYCFLSYSCATGSATIRLTNSQCSISCCWKIMEDFSSSVAICRKTFQQEISDSHSLLELSELRPRICLQSIWCTSTLAWVSQARGCQRPPDLSGPLNRLNAIPPLLHPSRPLWDPLCKRECDCEGQTDKLPRPHLLVQSSLGKAATQNKTSFVLNLHQPFPPTLPTRPTPTLPTLHAHTHTHTPHTHTHTNGQPFFLQCRIESRTCLRPQKALCFEALEASNVASTKPGYYSMITSLTGNIEESGYYLERAKKT